MHFKLIVAFVDDHWTQKVMEAARDAGATGITVIGSARGEGIKPAKTFLGLSIDSHVDVILMLAEEHMSRDIMEKVAIAGEFDELPGSGIAFQVDVEDAIGVRSQIAALTGVVEERL